MTPITPLFLFVEFNFAGIAGKFGNMVTVSNFSGELISMVLPESLAGSECSVRWCELVTNKDYQKYWYRDYRIKVWES